MRAGRRYRRALRRGLQIGPTIRKLQAAGKTSLRAIAAIPRARGQGEWSAVQVARVLELLG